MHNAKSIISTILLLICVFFLFNKAEANNINLTVNNPSMIGWDFEVQDLLTKIISISGTSQISESASTTINDNVSVSFLPDDIGGNIMYLSIIDTDELFKKYPINDNLQAVSSAYRVVVKTSTTTLTKFNGAYNLGFKLNDIKDLVYDKENIWIYYFSSTSMGWQKASSSVYEINDKKLNANLDHATYFVALTQKKAARNVFIETNLIINSGSGILKYIIQTTGDVDDYLKKIKDDISNLFTKDNASSGDAGIKVVRKEDKINTNNNQKYVISISEFLVGKKYVVGGDKAKVVALITGGSSLPFSVTAEWRLYDSKGDELDGKTEKLTVMPGDILIWFSNEELSAGIYNMSLKLVEGETVKDYKIASFNVIRKNSNLGSLTSLVINITITELVFNTIMSVAVLVISIFMIFKLGKTVVVKIHTKQFDA